MKAFSLTSCPSTQRAVKPHIDIEEAVQTIVLHSSAQLCGRQDSTDVMISGASG